jgi:predicted nucleic acid-binding protein
LREAGGWKAGEWRREFAKRGRTLTQADCLIAVVALGVNAHLAPGNAMHFPFQELVVDEWTSVV